MKKLSKLFFLLTIIIVVTGCGSSEKTYGLNESVEINSYSLTITDVKKTSDVVEITYDLKNNSSATISKDEWNFTAKDKSENTLGSVSVSNSKCEVASGNTKTCKVAYKLNSSKNYVKLSYFDDYLSANVDAIFSLEW